MSNKTIDRLARLSSGSPKPREEEKPIVKKLDDKGARTPLLNRKNAIAQVASGKQRMSKLLLHSPSRIRMWEGHNRDYEKLSAERCKDLIDGFKRTGEQEFPAIVRKVTDSEKYDFEVICGARRHWTANYLEWDLLVEVRDLSDKAAFILMDIENRDREDVSDYERACDYVAALPVYFDNIIEQMAKFLEIDRGNLSRLLELAKLPSEIINAYADIRDLKAHHGVVYKNLMKEAGTKKRILQKARSLKETPLKGKLVLAELKKAAASKQVKKKFEPRQYGSLTLVRQSEKGKLAIECNTPNDEPAIQALKDDFAKLIDSISMGNS